MSKRVKINFENINNGRYEIIPPEKVAESRERIKQNMKTFIKKINNKNSNNLNNVWYNWIFYCDGGNDRWNDLSDH